MFHTYKLLIRLMFKKKPLENTEVAIKNGKLKETGNIGYTRRIVIKYLMIGVNFKYHNVVIDIRPTLFSLNYF